MLKEQIMNVIPALKEEEDPRVTAFTVERDDFVQAIMDLANKCGYDALLDLALWNIQRIWSVCTT